MQNSFYIKMLADKGVKKIIIDKVHRLIVKYILLKKMQVEQFMYSINKHVHEIFHKHSEYRIDRLIKNGGIYV